MTETTIGIFVMPHEIDMFERLCYQLRRNQILLEDPHDMFNVKVRAILCLSDELTDWEKSSIDREFFKDKFFALEKTLDDFDSVEFNVHYGSEILGCTSFRRWLTSYADTEYITWLDCDMIIGDYFLMNTMYSLQAIDRPNVIVTPEIVRIWDSTWDDLVNKNYIDWDHERYKSTDLLRITMESDAECLYGEGFSLEEIPIYKFAGGWGTTLSKSLLTSANIPRTFSHYGLEDTYVMTCCEVWKDGQHPSFTIPVQYVMRNCVVGEDYLNRDEAHITDRLVRLDRRDEFKYITESNWTQEVQRFRERLNNGEV